jgi:hypothetical protein
MGVSKKTWPTSDRHQPALAIDGFRSDTFSGMTVALSAPRFCSAQSSAWSALLLA